MVFSHHENRVFSSEAATKFFTLGYAKYLLPIQSLQRPATFQNDQAWIGTPGNEASILASRSSNFASEASSCP